MQLAKAIRERRSVRSYKEDPVPYEVIQDIVNSGRMAPIGMGRYEQMHFSVVTDKQLLADIAQAGSDWGGIKPKLVTYEAPLLVVVATVDDDPTIPSRPGEPLVGINAMNAACAIENMLLTAVAHGLGSVFLYSVTEGINSSADLRERLRVPEGFKVQASCAVGYPANECGKEKDMSRLSAVDYL